MWFIHRAFCECNWFNFSNRWECLENHVQGTFVSGHTSKSNRLFVNFYKSKCKGVYGSPQILNKRPGEQTYPDLREHFQSPQTQSYGPSLNAHRSKLSGNVVNSHRLKFTRFIWTHKNTSLLDAVLGPTVPDLIDLAIANEQRFPKHFWIPANPNSRHKFEQQQIQLIGAFSKY